ncbi:hypothetical protein [Caldalkalibacillus thermarum]|uniref:hypothetical protein n=1 Tax=Caldalkalibacillus thermarum TaxID=296745 RepID=UPI0030846B6C
MQFRGRTVLVMVIIAMVASSMVTMLVAGGNTGRGLRLNRLTIFQITWIKLKKRLT